MFDRLEQVDERVAVGYNALGRLNHMGVTRPSTYELVNGTYVKKDSETGLYRLRRWECLQIKFRDLTHAMSLFCRTRPKASARDATDEILDKIDTVILMDFMILSLP